MSFERADTKRCLIVGGVLLTIGLLPARGQAEDPIQRPSPHVALVAVQYGPQQNEPLITPHLEAIGGAMERQWNGTVWTQAQVNDAAHAAWLFNPGKERLADFSRDVAKAQTLFTEKGTEAAIPVLERLVEESDDLLPQVSDRPPEALLMLKAHLLLWWSLEQAGERGRLVPLMQQTVRRFPAAEVTTRQWPPAIAEAFAVARQVVTLEQASITFRLKNAPSRGCTVTVNGFEHGDGRSGGLGVAKGQPYYISARCQDMLLRPRRVIAHSTIEIEIDVELTRRLAQTSAGPVLRVEGGPGSVGELVRLSSGLGRVLNVPDIVLAGAFEEEGKTMLQLDRVDVAAGKRICSVRLEVEAMEAWAIEKAIHVLYVRKPTASAPVVFASEDNVYRSVGEYVDWAAEDVSYAWTWTFVGLTAASLGTASFFAYEANEFDAELAACAASQACRQSAQIEVLRQDVGDSDDLRNIFLLTSAAVGVGTIIAFLLERPGRSDVLAPDVPSASRSEILFTPWVKSGGGGLGFSVSLD